jgi:hypothetical protein
MATDHQPITIIATPSTAEEPTGPSRGPVVLDIGGEVGAVVIHTHADLDGTEIEVRRVGAEWDGTHVAVRSRPTTGQPVYAAVFSQLPESEHEFRLRPPRPDGSVHRIRVVGGGLVEFPWG